MRIKVLSHSIIRHRENYHWVRRPARRDLLIFQYLSIPSDCLQIMKVTAAAATAAKSLQSCPTLCDPIDGSPVGSPIPGFLQARTLECVAIAFSNAWKWKVKVKSLSRVRLFATPWTAAFQAPPSMGFSRQEYWSEGCLNRLLWIMLSWIWECRQLIGILLPLPITRNGIDESWSSFIFNSVSNLCIIFHSSWTNLRSHQ